MKLTKEELDQPFDRNIFYPDSKGTYHTLKGFNNIEYYIDKDGLLEGYRECTSCDWGTDHEILQCPTNIHFIYIADALGILNKDEYL